MGNASVRTRSLDRMLSRLGLISNRHSSDDVESKKSVEKSESNGLKSNWKDLSIDQAKKPIGKTGNRVASFADLDREDLSMVNPADDSGEGEEKRVEYKVHCDHCSECVSLFLRRM